MAANVVSNTTRGDRRRDRLTARLHTVPDAPGAEPRPAAQPGGTDDDPVRRALARLSGADQEVLRLAAWEDLPPADIARVLGCSANAAAARLSRAKRRLRAALGESAPPSEPRHHQPEHQRPIEPRTEREVRRA